VLSEPEDEDSVMKWSQLMTSALKKGLQMADDLTDHFFEVNHFRHNFLNFKHEMKAVMAPYKEMYMDK
jgi:hypothetical protein